MKVGDVVKLTWLDTGLMLHDVSLDEACEAELCEVVIYGEVAHIDSRKVVIIQEIGRPATTGTFGLVARGAIKEVILLEPATTAGPNAETKDSLIVTGWEDLE